jgi:hypothetical protein
MQKRIIVAFIGISIAMEARAIPTCPNGRETSVTGVRGDGINLQMAYCHSFATDQTTEVIEPKKVRISSPFLMPLADKASPGSHWQAKVKTFPHNRCDWIEVSDGQQLVVIGIGRWSPGCKTPYFGKWPISPEPGPFAVPTAIRSKVGKWHFTKASQSWVN